jgi:hypothetical protein
MLVTEGIMQHLMTFFALMYIGPYYETLSDIWVYNNGEPAFSPPPVGVIEALEP